MRIRIQPFWLAAVLVLVCALVQPFPVSSQCVTGMSTMGTTSTPAYIYIQRTFTNATQCHLTMFMNVKACFPGGQTPVGPFTSVTRVNGAVTASAFTTATNVSCGWVCMPCGSIVVNGANDDLPVELMDFSVDGDETDENPGVEESP